MVWGIVTSHTSSIMPFSLWTHWCDYLEAGGSAGSLPSNLIFTSLYSSLLFSSLNCLIFLFKNVLLPTFSTSPFFAFRHFAVVDLKQSKTAEQAYWAWMVISGSDRKKMQWLRNDHAPESLHYRLLLRGVGCPRRIDSFGHILGGLSLCGHTARTHSATTRSVKQKSIHQNNRKKQKNLHVLDIFTSFSRCI